MTVKLSPSADDGFVVYSHAGDDTIECRDYVRGRLGMPPWQPKARAHSNGSTMNSDIENAIAGKPEIPRVVATYRYLSPDGALLYEVQRFEPKTFRQRRPLPGGRYAYDLSGVTPILYRLPELIKFPDATVFICEGEKDADRVASLGLTATTVSGSTTWTTGLAEPLRGRDVFVLADNDDPGRDKAAKASSVLHGIAKSVRIVPLPGLPAGGDVSDFLDAGHTRADLESACLAAPLFDPETAKTEEKPEEKPLPFADISAWRVDQGVPARDWAVRDVFPRRNVVLLSGEGSAGKSLLALQLAVAHVLGRDWIGTLPEPGPVIVLSAEEEADELHRRLADILRYYRSDFDTICGHLHLLSLAGEDAVLGHADRGGLMQPTPLYRRLMKAATLIRPVLIVVDTAADVFAGSEIDRAQVRQFISMLRRLAIEANAYVLICSHPSLSGINSGSGISGSTAWHNSVRARAYLTAPKTERDDEPDPTLRLLEFKKSNYGPVSHSLALRWDRGVYRPVGGPAALDRLAREQAAERLFLALLDRFNASGRHVTQKEAARNYAPTAFAKEADAKAQGFRKADLEAAMRRLFDKGQIVVQTYGPPCRGTTCLVTR
jgi:RecA-family ATPase